MENKIGQRQSLFSKIQDEVAIRPTITDKEDKDYDPSFTRRHTDYSYHARVYGEESLSLHITKLKKDRGIVQSESVVNLRSLEGL